MKKFHPIVLFVILCLTASILACNAATSLLTGTANLKPQTDSTDTLTVSLPADWTEVDATPKIMGVSGLIEPPIPAASITASTSISQFNNLSAPGITVKVAHAVSLDADDGFLSAMLDNLAAGSAGSACQTSGTDNYSDAQYSGYLETLVSCPSGGVVAELAVRSLQSKDIVIELTLMTASGGSEAQARSQVKSILSTLKIDPALTSKVPQTFDDYSNMKVVTDQTGSITVSVPPLWTEVEGTPSTSGSVPQAKLIAATDLKNTLWTSPYVGILVYPPNVAVGQFSSYASDLMHRDVTIFHQCKLVDTVSYSDSAYQGMLDVFQNCDESNDVFLTMEVRSVQGDYQVSVLLNSAPGDTPDHTQALLKAILASLKVNVSSFPK